MDTEERMERKAGRRDAKTNRHRMVVKGRNVVHLQRIIVERAARLKAARPALA